MTEIKEYLTTEDIQRIFKLKSVRAAHALMNTPGFPAMRLGRFYRVHPDELEKWMKQNSRKSFDLSRFR